MNKDKEDLKERLKEIVKPAMLSPEILIASSFVYKSKQKILEATIASYARFEKDYKKRLLKKLKYLRRKDAQKLRRKRKKRKMKERKR